MEVYKWEVYKSAVCSKCPIGSVLAWWPEFDRENLPGQQDFLSDTSEGSMKEGTIQTKWSLEIVRFCFFDVRFIKCCCTFKSICTQKYYEKVKYCKFRKVCDFVQDWKIPELNLDLNALN